MAWIRRLFGIVSLVAVLLISQRAIAKDVTLSWDPSPTPAVSGYLVLVSLNAQMTSSWTIDAGNVLTIIIPGLADIADHWFCVKSYLGLDKSVCSNVVHSPPVEEEKHLPMLDLNINTEIIK
ncbi:hypothetical protein [uncultured Desulfuromusa sp.]|uniref:hypothetical protein n=1 Tax=uncultured Desulfuromusa sp. TaxID=219183 RepID=UPI002AA662BB|nr:hypothetical protein [uncultured Desulfuromusa sp.]